MMETPTHTCCRCKTAKVEDDFAKDRGRKSGRKPYCRECGAIAEREYRERARLAPEDIPPEKRCLQCDTVKPISDFHNCKTRKDGKQAYCKACTAANAKGWYSRNRDKAREKGQEWYALNKDAISERRKNDPTLAERQRRSTIKRLYKLTLEQVDEMLEAQDWACAICRQEFGDSSPDVDHDHACCPGKESCGGCVRQLLCSRCNLAIGMLHDDPELILTASRYVAEHRQAKIS